MAWRNYFTAVSAAATTGKASLMDSYYTLLGLHVLSSFAKKPVVIVTPANTLLSSDSKLTVSFTNTIGQTIDDGKVSGSLSINGESSSLTFSAAKNGFTASLSQKKAGIYLVTVQFSAPGYIDDSFTFYVTISGPVVNGKSATYHLTPDNKAGKISVNFPEPAKEVINADGTNHVIVSFTLTGKPVQAFVQIMSEEKNEVAVTVLPKFKVFDFLLSFVFSGRYLFCQH